MTPQEVQDAIRDAKKVRVLGVHPARAGWTGTITKMDTGPGFDEAYVRWDEVPQADPERVEFKHLSVTDVLVRATKPQPDPASNRSPRVGDRVWGISPSRAHHTGEIYDIDADRGFVHELYRVRWDDPGMDDEWMRADEFTTSQPDPFRATRFNIVAGRRVRNNRDGRLGVVKSNSLSYRVGEDLITIQWDGDSRLSTQSSYADLDMLGDDLRSVGANLPALATSPDADVAEVPRQPDPVPNGLPHIADLVVERVMARKAVGLAEYGTPLQPRNGRDALADAIDELLDGAHYLMQAMWERDHRPPAHEMRDLNQVGRGVSIGWEGDCTCGWKTKTYATTARTWRELANHVMNAQKAEIAALRALIPGAADG